MICGTLTYGLLITFFPRVPLRLKLWEMLLFLFYLPCLILFRGHRHSYLGVANFINIFVYDLYILWSS